MSWLSLYDYQREAVSKMKTGCILNGGTGSGKSRTALAYYYIRNGGNIDSDDFVKMTNPKDLYIITTAKKRDDRDWSSEMLVFSMTDDAEHNPYNNSIVVDSWNNIAKYADISGAFFIFDEQRVKGKGKWVKSFLKIAKHNEWILLSATPGDDWEAYIPVFIANGFYKNRTEFQNEHFVYKRYTSYPVVDHVVNEGRLIRLRRKILIPMDFERKTVQHHEDVYCEFDRELYKKVVRERWNIYTDMPCTNAAEYCSVLRRIVNSDERRQKALLELYAEHPRAIIFYNFDYELEILKSLDYGEDVEVAEYNGHKHQEVPKGFKWVYLVQYNAGSEAWNCISTDTIIFYSQNYSYAMMTQAAGRIDRANTPYTDLHYYHFRSRSSIDIAVARALRDKKKFNESAFAGDYFRKEMSA